MNSFHPSPFNGTIVVSAAAMTPGVFLTFSRSSRLYSRRLAVATLRGEKSKSATRILFCRNPTSRLSRFLKVRTNKQGRNQQHQRERNLRDDQSSAQQEAFASCGQPASACLHHRPGIGIGRLNRRRHSKQHAGQQRHPKRERQHPKIGVSGKKNRILRAANVRNQNPAQPLSQRDANGRTAQRKQQALRQQLPDQPHARGPKRQPQSHLALPRTCPGQHQVGQVCARNQQDQSGDGKQHPQRVCILLSQR